MHITNDRLVETLTNIELLHIRKCSQCRDEQKKLMALKVAANNFEFVQPPEQVWQRIQKSQSHKKRKASHFRQYIYASAASLFCLTVVWLVWTNHDLQIQLEEALLVNQSLELQLVQDKIPTYQQTQLLLDVKEVESALLHYKTDDEKLALLKRRLKLVKKIVHIQGNKNEIFI